MSKTGSGQILTNQGQRLQRLTNSILEIVNVVDAL